MKKNIFITLLVIFASTSVYAQKFAYIDTDYILKNIPSYKGAQDQVDKLSKEWETEIQGKFAEIEKMYKSYQSEKVLLTDEMKTKREEEIVKKEQEVKDLQKKYFGREGMLNKKRTELMKPIQDEVYNAVKEIALEQGIAIVFDTYANPAVFYSNSKNDKSDEVLQRLGYKN
jgi:outer membrane protein